MYQQFQTLNSLLLSHQNFWRVEPFYQSYLSDLPWKSESPELCAWLESLDYQEIEYLKEHPEHLNEVIIQYIPGVYDLSQTALIERMSLEGLSLERGMESGVPGRKLEQILSMGEAALNEHNGTEWLEWCSGKGFLGRVLASESHQKVTSFEYQQSLCDAGQLEANKRHLPMTFVQGDALSDIAEAVLNPNQHAVALHACGDLHVSLIEKGAHQQLPAMTIAPCCYHLIQSNSYQPLSKAAKQSELRLSKTELRIPLQETVTGGQRVKRHRFQEMSYRLGFDLLLRNQCAVNTYIPIPSIKKSQLSEGFEAFCHWAAEQKQITLPEVDFNQYQQLGEQRYWHMERLSLVQQVFRRGLELWLVMDKALYLTEQGYQVSLREFCAKEVTPRNILIHAFRP
tara:strand:- start:1840 stop:3033 length:1194 start_codon:yes stop_codon:yes gene_type:complete